jgi:UDP-4-amino-4,6-dideoxy-N-acetyl-beta-L-altrosamine N-acetyltransferase
MKIDKNKIYQIENYQFKNFISLTDKEIEHIWKWRNDYSIRKYMYTTNIIPIESHFQFVKSLKERFDVSYWLVFKDKKAIGITNLTNINVSESSAELGYYMIPERMNSGIGLEFAYYNLLFTFKSIECEYLHGGINKANINALVLDSYLGCDIKSNNSNENSIFVTWEAQRSKVLPALNGKNDIKSFVKFMKAHRETFITNK